MKITNTTIKEFQKTIWDFYKQNKREFPWRNTTDPYKILISEVMLQQTQTYRVQPKYETWITKFPDFKTLATSPFSDVLQYWSGLGYNRRALYLQKTAQVLEKDYKGNVPQDPHELIKLPGIGKATAASIIVFSYNLPLVFIETNIRRVFIHFFFSSSQSSRGVKRRGDLKINEIASYPSGTRNDDELIHDKDIFPLIEKTLDTKNPREWYYALMDYGSILAKTENVNRKSKHYTKQSQFEGSIRQVRGKILKLLLNHKKLSIDELKKEVNNTEEKFNTALNQLEKEKFVKIESGKIVLF